MIDLSYLTEEEQQMIMTVLKRDSDLKKAEEERIKQLQKVAAEEEKLKYMTGEWFYEAKSQRHKDRIHGSDIIIASLKPKKPLKLEFTQSWGDRLRKMSRRNNDVVAPPKPPRMLVASDQLQERESSIVTEEAQEEQLKLVMRSPPKPRHNPFNSMPVDLDLEDPDRPLSNSVSESARSSHEEVPSSQISSDTSLSNRRTEGSDTTDERSARQAPVPKKRTKISKPQSSTSLSDSTSSVSTQSITTGSDIRTPPPRGILRYSSSCSSSDSNNKVQSLQPAVTLISISSITDEVRTAEDLSVAKNKAEDSLVISQDGEQTKPREKPKLYPRKSLTSRTLIESNSQANTLQTNTQKSEASNGNNFATPTESQVQKKVDNSINELESSRLFKKTDLAYINYSDKPSNENPNLQPSQTNLKEMEKNETSFPDKVTETVQNDKGRIQTSTDHQGQHSFDSSLDFKRTDFSLSFDIAKKSTPGKEDDHDDRKSPLRTVAQNSTPTEEQEDSIAKVLDWFSKSTDSSDMLDTKSIVQDQDNTKEDDIDFEGDVKLSPKPAENTYSIITRQEKTNETNTILQCERRWGKERSVDETTKVESPKLSPPPYSSLNISHQKVQVTVADTLSQKEKVSAVAQNKGEEYSAQENADREFSTALRQSPTDDTKSPLKIANLRSFWERENVGPKILISRSNLHSGNEDTALNQGDVSSKSKESMEKQPEVVEKTSPVPYRMEKASVRYGSDLKNREDSGNHIQTHFKELETVDTYYTKDTSTPLSKHDDQKKETPSVSTTSDMDVTPVMQMKTPSLSLSSGSESRSQSSENVKSPSITDSLGDRVSLTGQEYGHGANIKEKEPCAELRSPTRSRGHMEKINSVSLSKQSFQQPDHKADKIKQLKSFWESEQRGTIMYGAKPVNKSSVISSAKLSKRFTKSEFDLTAIGNESGEDSDSLSSGNQQSRNFTVIPLKDRTEKSFTIEKINHSQFKNLRDFWGGSPTKQLGPKSVSEYKFNVPPTSKQSEKVYAELYGKDNHLSSSSVKGKTERGLQIDGPRRLSDSKPPPPYPGRGALQRPEVSQPQRGSQQTKDRLPPRPQGTQDKGSRTQQVRRNNKSSSNGRASVLRRATSMYAVNIDEDQDQELVLQSSKVQSPPPYKKTHEVILTQSRKTQGTNNLQSKRSPEVQGSLSTRRPSRSSEGSGSPQPLARSFIPKDIQHYLGISDNSSTFSTGPVTGESGDFICTSFCTAPEKDPCIMSGPVKASTPLGSEEFSRRGNQGLRTMHKMHDSDDVSQGSSKSSISDTLSHSQARSNWEESPVQKALRRAATRPVFHKSLEDITALPRTEQKMNQTNDFGQSHYDTEATPPSSTSSFSDPSRMKILSKSVPSFLEKESDEEDSGSTSDNSFQSGTPQKIGRSLTNVSNSSGMASVSSTSSSVMSVDSGDFGNVEVQGTIQFTINYVQKLREFHIFIVQCKNLAAVDLKRNRSDPYVKSYLIPDSANLGKRKTAVKKRTLNPSYNEILRYRVRMDYLKTQVLNLSVWHNDTFGRNIFLGEVEIDLSTWDFSTTPMNNLPLKPKNVFLQTVSSLNASDYRGDLRVAIRFMPQISQTRTVSKMGEVHIWVKECKNLPLIRGTTIDPYVKCCVLPDTSRKSRQKTRVLKRTVNPVFNHTMVYDGFHTEDLKEACVELTVWDHDRLANHLLGGVRLGLGTGKSYGVQVDWMDSTREEVTVWQRMIESPNEWVENVLPLRVVMAAKNAWK